MSSKLFPPSVLISRTPPSKPTFGSRSDASSSKLCRKVNCGESAGRGNGSESNRLSLNTSGSSTNAAFGNVSAGGVGTPEFDVSHSGGGPWAFVESQPGGNMGGVTLSKFSLNAVGKKQGGEHEGIGGGVGVKLGATCGSAPDENIISRIAVSTEVNRTSALDGFTVPLFFYAPSSTFFQCRYQCASGIRFQSAPDLL